VVARRPPRLPQVLILAAVTAAPSPQGHLIMAGFALGVEDELGVMTQLATPGGLKLRIRDRVLREAVAL